MAKKIGPARQAQLDEETRVAQERAEIREQQRAAPSALVGSVIARIEYDDDDGNLESLTISLAGGGTLKAESSEWLSCYINGMLL